jgi:hypothetical protein
MSGEGLGALRFVRCGLYGGARVEKLGDGEEKLVATIIT